MRALIIAAAWLAVSTAQAKEMDAVGALGANAVARGHLAVGSLSTEVVRDQSGYGDYQTSAGVFLARAEGSAFFVPTRLGTLVGLEGGITGGWMGKDSNLPEPVDGMADPEPPAWYGLYIGLDAGVVAGLVHRQNLHLQFRGGATLDVDALSVYLGGRLWLGGQRFSFELTGDAHYGRSFSDDQVREWQLTGLVQFRSWGLGIRHVQGFSEDQGNETSTRRLFKGAYQLTTLELVWNL